jgi:two-component system, cell cycle sensor histidine kinase and response regulator CckA
MTSHTALDQLQQIALFADELPVAIWVGKVPSGECVYVNKAFREVLGIDPPSGAARGNYVGPYSVHTHDGALYPEQQMPFERVMAARAQIEVDDLVIHRHDGGRTYLRVLARPLFDASGEITHVVEAFTDISREIRAQQIEFERQAQLRQTQRMESLGGLAGGIAHDFNNLLTAIKVIASDLSTRSGDNEVRTALAQIDEVTDSAARLTHALLGFARQGKHEKQRLSLNDIVRSVAEIARRTIGKQIEVRCELHPSDLQVDGDPAQLEQLLMNLIVNARDAIEGPGHVVIRTFPQVLDDADPELPAGAYATLEVEDSGAGIPPSALDRIFEPYFTTKTAGTVKGTGLGLATVFGIVESHGGSVGVLRSDDSGTVMRARLPLADDAEPYSIAPSSKASKVAGKGSILLVDDEQLVLRATARALHGLGYRIVTAADGVAALEAFRRQRFDAVILDLVMPNMDGQETFAALRALDPNVRVLLVTGFGLNTQAQALLDQGVRGFVAKPFSVAELSSELARLLGPANG